MRSSSPCLRASSEGELVKVRQSSIKSVLILCPAAVGGAAEHVYYQACALQELGVNVSILCPTNYLENRSLDVDTLRWLPSGEVKARSTSSSRSAGLIKCLNALRFFGRIVAAFWILSWQVVVRRPDAVLIASFLEYFSPFWVWPHLVLAKTGFVLYAANLQDPVRNWRLGPKWWHRLSVRLAFAPLSAALIHEFLPDKSVVPSHVLLAEAPVGIYELNHADVDATAVRDGWSLGKEQVVFLAFGFIRDNKNVDLLIRALARIPLASLAVVGRAQSSRNRPVQYYRDLAAELGVADRVRFSEEFVPDERLAGYFSAADVIAITYSKEFHSQSGVLNVAARSRKLVLASSGEGPLKTAVTKFGLGKFVEPDDLDSMVAGMGQLCDEVKKHRGQAAAADKSQQQSEQPNYAAYELYASWRANAAVLLEVLDKVRNARAKA